MNTYRECHKRFMTNVLHTYNVGFEPNVINRAWVQWAPMCTDVQEADVMLGIIGAQLKDPLKLLVRHSNMLPIGLSRAINWFHIMSRGLSLSDCRWRIFQFIHSYFHVEKQQRLSTSWQSNWGYPETPPTITEPSYWRVKGTLNWSPIMPRDGSLSNSRCEFFFWV